MATNVMHLTSEVHNEERGTPPLLEVRDLVKEFDLTSNVLDRWSGRRKVLHAVDGVTFTVLEGHTVGLVGESGCGKSTTARLISHLLPATSGRILFRGQDILSLSPRQLKPLRKNIQMVFQDPFSSLNPRKQIVDIVGRPVAIHFGLRRRALVEQVVELLQSVGLKPEHLYRYPHEFSGGQRQRIAIARALATAPDLLIADEPVSALDVSVQAQVLNLLVGLKSERQFSMLFVSHDLSVVEHLCDEVAVMYAGKIVELASAEALFARPQHPYTQMLLAAHLEPDPYATTQPIAVRGEPLTPINPVPGCRFASRCPWVSNECLAATPPLSEKADRHYAACIKV